MRVGIVSDTHGFIDPRVVEAIAGCEIVVHGGDAGSAEVLQALERVSARVVAVRGNNDVPAKWIGAKAALRALPTEARVELPGGVLVVVHGDRVLPVARRHERLRMLYAEARAVVYGHSHHRVIDTRAVPWIVNPGASGRARTFGGPSLFILEATTKGWTIRERVLEPLRVSGCASRSGDVEAIGETGRAAAESRRASRPRAR